MDRIRLPIWIGSISVLPAVTYSSYRTLFPSEASRASLTKSLGTNPALSLLYGTARNLATAGGFTAWRTGVFSCVFIAVMAILTVVRHTRSEEESGRAELVGSTCVGRFALNAAGILLAVASCVVTGALTAGGLVVVGASPSGAACFGLLLASTGIFFTAVAAVCCQVLTFSRSAASAGMMILALCYLLRAWGDATSTSFITWLSPLGWIEKADPFGACRPAIAFAALAASAILFVAAGLLLNRRDIGAGVLTPNDGPAVASWSLSGPFGLVWRLNAKVSLLWIVGLGLFASVFGAAVKSLTSVLEENPALKTFLTHGSGTLGDLFVAEIISILAVMATVGGVQVLLKSNTEERAGRTGLLLSSSLTRSRLLASQLVMALGTSSAAILVGGLALSVGSTITGSPVSLRAVLEAAAVQLPAIWVLVAFVAALIGVAPRMSVLALPIVAVTFVLLVFGPVLNLPGAIQSLSVFSHLPRAPAAPLSVAPMLVLSGCAALLVGCSILAFTRRDIG